MVEKGFLSEEFLKREALLYNKEEEINEINRTMDEINNSDFEIKELKLGDKKIKYSELLKNVALCYNSIKELNLPYGEMPRIEKLQDIMRKKYKALNPELNDDAIDALGYSHCFYRPDYYYDGKKCEKITLDILVIEDVVFVTQGIVDKLGNVCSIDIHNIGNSYYSVFSDNHCPRFDKKASFLDIIGKDEDYIIHKMHMYHDLSFLINLICGKDVTRPSFALESEHMDDLDYPLSSYENLFGIKANKYGHRIYINAKFEDIESSWENLEECDYKLCVLTEKSHDDYSEEDITLYTIHQSFKNKCAEWSIIRENHDIWRLTDAASKIKKPEVKKILCKRDDRIKKKP